MQFDRFRMDVFSRARILRLLCVLCSAFGEIPPDLRVDLEAMVETRNITIGQVVPMKLTVSFPQWSSHDTKLEIMTSVKRTLFAIKELDRTGFQKGSNLQFDNADWLIGAKIYRGVDQTAGAGIEYKTRVVMKLQNVQNNGVSQDIVDSQLVVNYALVHVAQNRFSNGDEVLTSAGMEYLDETRIVVVQVPFNIHEVNQSSEFPKPTFEMEQASEIELMTPLTLALKMTLPYPASNVTVSVATGLDGELSVRRIQAVSVSQAFDYSVNPGAFGITAFSTCQFQNNLSLYMGTLVNSESWRESRTYTDHDVIVDITWQVQMRSTPNEIVSTDVVVTINEEEFKVTTLYLTVVNQTSQDLGKLSFTLESPAENTVSPGFWGRTSLSIVTPPTSYIDYVINLRTSLTDENKSALSIIAINTVGYGANLPCEMRTSLLTFDNLTHSGAPNDKVTVSFSLPNLGFGAGDDVNTLTLDVIIMMMPDAVEGHYHELFVEMAGISEQQVNFIVGQPMTYHKPVNFEMEVENACSSDEYQSGTIASFLSTVTTERSKTPGPLTVKFPIPQNLTTSSPLAFHSARVVSKGRNVVCVDVGKIPAELSDWNADYGGNDKAILTLPLVCNVGAVDDPKEDIFVMRIQAKIKDVPEILNSASVTTVKFGIGAKYPESKMWVGMSSIKVQPPMKFMIPDVTYAQLVVALEMPDVDRDNEVTSITNYMLQWSHNNKEFHNVTSDASICIEITMENTQLQSNVVGSSCMDYFDVLITGSSKLFQTSDDSFIFGAERVKEQNCHSAISTTKTSKEQSIGTVISKGLTVKAWHPTVQNKGHKVARLVRPFVASFVRVFNPNSFCIRYPYRLWTSIPDTPQMYGSLQRSGPLLERMALALDDSSDTCFALPTQDEKITTPFLWIEMKKWMFGLSNSTRFNVTLVGEGIQCHNRDGPQITYLSFPKKATSSSFQGNKVLCTHTENRTVETTKTECNYTCACRGLDQCQKFSLLMLNSDTSTNYTLCTLKVTDA